MEPFKKVDHLSILVVEDSEPIRKTIVIMLNQLGFKRIDVVEDGLKAWEKLLLKDYHFILSDINMPKMTGIQLLQKLRSSKTEHKRKIPVLFITSSKEQRDIVHAVKWKVNGYLVKPVELKDLQEKLGSILPTLED